MTQGIKDPITGKTFVYKGFVPLSRLGFDCGDGKHFTSCMSAPQILLPYLGFEFTKESCCLCKCHFEGEVK